MLAEREEPRFVDTCGEKRSRQGYYFYVVDDIAIWSNNAAHFLCSGEKLLARVLA